MTKNSPLIVGSITGGMCGVVSPFLMRLSDNWIGGVGITVTVSCMIGVAAGLTARLILKNKEGKNER